MHDHRPPATPRQASPAAERLERWVRHAFRPARPALVFASAGDADGEPGTPGCTVIEVCSETSVRWRHALPKPPDRVSWADVIHAANLWDRERRRRRAGDSQ